MNAHSEKVNEESVSDIIAEMREESAKADLEQNYTLDDAAESMREFAGRIEAAWKREKAGWESAACAFVSDAVMSGKVAVEHAPVGNAAAMREAVELLNQLFDSCVLGTHSEMTADEMEKVDELYFKTKAALSAPARNCDRLSAEQCKKIFEMEMGIYLPQEATDRDRDIARCTAYGVIDALFAQSTEREGESDGSK